MGKGIDLAAADNPELAAMIDDMKDQLLMVFLRRLGGALTIPCSEINDTGALLFMVAIDVEKREFTFELGRKS